MSGGMKGYLEGLQSKGGFVLCQLMAFLNMVIRDADQYPVRKTFLFLAVGLLNCVFRFNIKSSVRFASRPHAQPGWLLEIRLGQRFCRCRPGKGQNVLSDVMTMAPRSSPARAPPMLASHPHWA